MVSEIVPADRDYSIHRCHPPTEEEKLYVGLAQGSAYLCPEPLRGLERQVLYEQIRSVATKHCDLEEPSAGVPGDVRLWLYAAHLGKRHELLTVGEAVSG